MPRRAKSRKRGFITKRGIERLLRGSGRGKLRVSRKTVNRMAGDMEKIAKYIADEAARVAKERGHKTITELDYLEARDRVLGYED